MMQVGRCTRHDWERLSRSGLGETASMIHAEEAQVSNYVIQNASTLYHKGEPIACGGVTDTWGPKALNRVGTAWLIFGSDVPLSRGERVGAARLIRRQFSDLVVLGKYHLIEANVDRVDLVGQRFIGWLGFRFFGLREGFGPQGEDFILYGLGGRHGFYGNRGGVGRGGSAHERGGGSIGGEGTSRDGSV